MLDRLGFIERGKTIDWPAVWHAAEQLDNLGSDDGANAIRAMHAEMTNLHRDLAGAVEALREIARLEHVNAADSIVNAAGRDAREALDRLGGQS